MSNNPGVVTGRDGRAHQADSVTDDTTARADRRTSRSQSATHSCCAPIISTLPESPVRRSPMRGTTARSSAIRWRAFGMRENRPLAVLTDARQTFVTGLLRTPASGDGCFCDGTAGWTRTTDLRSHNPSFWRFWSFLFIPAVSSSVCILEIILISGF
jgi:hypothetical protein